MGGAKEEEEKEDSSQEPEEKENDAKSGVKVVCRKAIRFIFSTAGLFLVNFLYLIMGASIFTHLEKYNEEQTCFAGADNYARAENATSTLMLDVARRVAHGALQQKGGDSIIREDYANLLKRFSLSVLDINYDVSKNCSMLGQEDGPQYAWSWTGSLAFAMTVTTTIGYGVIAPKTQMGRIVCIAYAIVGLPIMLICLANVGDVLADIFRFAYATVCCCGCCRSKKKKQDTGEMTPVTSWRTDSTGRPIVDEYEDSEDEDDDEEDEEEEGEITVPLTVSLIVLFSFIFLGASLFFVWESWDFLDALYFCFVTFSTIGFGDIVPGDSNPDSASSQGQLIVTGVYQIVGMAMVSMCFQLMQDEIVAKVRWILQKIGFGKKSDKDQVTNDSNEETTF